MYIDHPHFPSLPEDLIIWRYMDFEKFLNLINQQALYFCRVDKLGDGYEGIVQPAIIERWKKEFQDEFDAKGISDDSFIKSIGEDNLLWRTCTMVNCWTMEQNESVAMWKMYAKNNLGIAIKTNFRNLKNAFNQIEEEILISQVKYTKYDDISMSHKNFLFPMINKNLYYQFEKEVRCFILAVQKIDGVSQPLYERGVLISTSLNTLIESIYLAPNAPEAYEKVINHILTDAGLEVPIVRSRIDDAMFKG